MRTKTSKIGKLQRGKCLQEHVANFLPSPAIQQTTFLAMFEIDSSSPEGKIIIYLSNKE